MPVVTGELWVDTDNNGTVDALVGNATTDASGEYYFVGSTTADPTPTDNIGQVRGVIFNNRAYQARIPSTNFASGKTLNARVPSPVDNDSSANGDSRDSDGSINIADLNFLLTRR